MISSHHPLSHNRQTLLRMAWRWGIDHDLPSAFLHQAAGAAYVGAGRLNARDHFLPGRFISAVFAQPTTSRRHPDFVLTPASEALPWGGVFLLDQPLCRS